MAQKWHKNGVISFRSFRCLCDGDHEALEPRGDGKRWLQPCTSRCWQSRIHPLLCQIGEWKKAGDEILLATAIIRFRGSVCGRCSGAAPKRLKTSGRKRFCPLFCLCVLCFCCVLVAVVFGAWMCSLLAAAFQLRTAFMMVYLFCVRVLYVWSSCMFVWSACLRFATASCRETGDTILPTQDPTGFTKTD